MESAVGSLRVMESSLLELLAKAFEARIQDTDHVMI